MEHHERSCPRRGAGGHKDPQDKAAPRAVHGLLGNADAGDIGVDDAVSFMEHAGKETDQPAC